MMNTRWERRDRKIAKRKKFKSDNRRSVRILYGIMIKKAQEVKDGRHGIIGSPDENLFEDYEEKESDKFD